MTQTRKEINTEKQPASKPTFMQSVITGSITGATEVMIDHPLWTIKTRVQAEQPFTLKPSIVYRGIVPNMLSMAPIAATQSGLNQIIQSYWLQGNDRLSEMQRVGAAFWAGAGSAIFSGPTERVMSHQTQSRGFYSTARYLVNQGGWSALSQGMFGTMLRDGKFTAFYLAVTPWTKSKIKPYAHNDILASLAAGMGTGVVAAVASQPDDTIKTKQQLAEPKVKSSYLQTAAKIYSEKGGSGFFSGGVPRAARMMPGVTIYAYVSEKLNHYFKEQNELKGGGSPRLK